MAFQVEITQIAESQIEQAYLWFRGLMNAIATLQQLPLQVLSDTLHLSV